MTRPSPDLGQAARARFRCRDRHGRYEVLLDWNWDEDRCTLRTGHGPEHITRLRRFTVGLIKAKSNDSVAATLDKLARKVRRVFEYLGMSKNSTPRARRLETEG